MMNSSFTPRRLRSFVRRDSCITSAQERAYQLYWPQFGIAQPTGIISFANIFGRKAPVFMEIGFGSGQSLLALAKAQPEKNFIGVETHKPGIGSLLLGIQKQQITNLRIFHGDVVDILQNNIPDKSLAGVQIFFPDPWPKRRHHPRRLIQPGWIKQLITKIIAGGSLHLATDWEDYAKHMLKVLSQEEALINQAGAGCFATRSPYRPIVTKFEQRAQHEGREIWDLQFCCS